MEWQIVVALVVTIPVILFPAAFVWYLNIGGIYSLIRELAKKRAMKTLCEKEVRETL